MLYSLKNDEFFSQVGEKIRVFHTSTSEPNHSLCSVLAIYSLTPALSKVFHIYSSEPNHCLFALF